MVPELAVLDVIVPSLLLAGGGAVRVYKSSATFGGNVRLYNNTAYLAGMNAFPGKNSSLETTSIVEHRHMQQDVRQQTGKRLSNLIAPTMSRTVYCISSDPAVRVPTMAGAVSLFSCPFVLIEGDMEFNNNVGNTCKSCVFHTHVSFPHLKGSRQIILILHAANVYSSRVTALQRRS